MMSSAARFLFNGLRERIGYLLSRPKSVDFAGTVKLAILPEPFPNFVWIEDGCQKLEANLSEYERKREALLLPLVQAWQEEYLRLADLKAWGHEVFDEIESLNTPRKTKRVTSGKSPSLTLFSLDRTSRISRKIADQVRFHEDTLMRAKNLIDACVERWEEGSKEEMKKLVALFFSRNAAGDFSRTMLVRLRKIESNDPDWIEAMKLIGEAEIVDGVTSYLLVSVRDDQGEYHPLPLDIASIRAARTYQGNANAVE